MAVITNNKIDKINLRINTKDKESLLKAARHNHLSLSAYIISTCLKQAEIDLAENEILKFDKEDLNFVMNLLENPPKPTKELINLFK